MRFRNILSIVLAPGVLQSTNATADGFYGGIDAARERLRYDTPYSASLTLQPAYQLSDRVAMFAEAGLALGRIHEHKWASPDSTYDERRGRPGLVLGAGVSLRLGDAWSARLGYRETRYRELRYEGRDAGGTVFERIRDKPRQAAWHVGLVRDF